MKLDQSPCYQVSVQRRPCTTFQTANFSRSINNKRHVATVLLDDFARCDDDTSSSTRIDDVNAGTRPLQSPTAVQTDDVDTNVSRDAPAGRPTQLSSSPTTRNDDVKIHPAQNGNVITYPCGEDGSRQPNTAELWNSLPEFEPRPAAAYRRRCSRMFFYDRLRSTHDYQLTDTDQSD